MEIAVAGGHGQIALRLLRLLAERGDRGRGLIRNADHADDLRAVGAEPVLSDLEGDEVDVESAVDGADAVVFAAGAGPGSGAERKRTMDLEGALRLIEAAKVTGVDRYVMISSMGADDPRAQDPVFRAYLEAKGAADAALRESGLRWTIVRPGGLTNDPGSGRVSAAPDLGRRGQIPRDDVAATLLAVLDEPRTAGVQFELLSGETPIADAVAAVAR